MLTPTLLVLLAQVLLEPVPAPTPSPTPALAPVAVAERQLEVGGQVRRVSLFSNRVAVVSVREGERQVLVQRLTLRDEEHLAYLTAFAAAARGLAGGRSLSSLEIGPRGSITLNLGGERARVEYWVGAAHDLPTGRLVAALDDLERRVLEANPAEAELHDWAPEVGDAVELLEGGRATVERVFDGGLVVLRLDGSDRLEPVLPEERGRRIRRLLGRPE